MTAVTWPGSEQDQGRGQSWVPPAGRQYQGNYPPSPFQNPPPGRRRTGLIVGLAVLAVVLALAAATGVYFVARNTSDPAGSPTTTTPHRGSATTEPPVTGSPGAGAGRPEAVVPGWQVAVSTERGFAYDVPPEWKVLDEDTLIGFEDAEGPKVGMAGASTYRDGYCTEADGSFRAAAGLSGYRDADLNLVAADAAGKWGRFGYLGPNDEPPQVEVAPAVPITVNGVKGAHSSATVRVTVASPCAPPAARVHVVALPAAQGSHVFVIIADQQVPDALPEDAMLKIINTVRPAR